MGKEITKRKKYNYNRPKIRCAGTPSRKTLPVCRFSQVTTSGKQPPSLRILGGRLREVRPHVFMNLCFYWFVFISVLLFPVVSLFPGPKICFVLLFLILKLLKPEASQWSIFNVAEHSFGSLWVYVICQIMAREGLQLTSWNLHWNKWKIYWWKVLIDQ